MRRSVKFHPLENGMMLYYRPHRQDRQDNVSGIGVRAGSIHDPPGKSGLAHFAEHVLTYRSRKYPDPKEVDRILSKYLGDPDSGDWNIRVDRSNTFFGHGLLLRRKHMLIVFDLLSSFLRPHYRILDVDGAKSEIAAIHQEYFLRGIDIPETFLDDLMHQTMYDKNPARNRVDCDESNLGKMTPEDVRRFLRRYYVPSNMFVIIFGPTLDQAQKLAEKCFGDWDTKTVPILDYDHSDDLPKFSNIKPREVPREGINQYHCAIGFPTENYLSDDAETIDVLGRILGFRLLCLLRGNNTDFDGGVYRVPVETERSLVHGMIYVSFATKSKDFEAAAEDVVIKEVKRLKSELVGQNELDMAKSRTFAEYWDAFWNTTEVLSELVIAAASNGDANLVRLHEFPERLKKVNSHRLRDVANKYLTKNYVRVLIKPA
jgi:predicted Zn-dependent peptidase